MSYHRISEVQYGIRCIHGARGSRSSGSRKRHQTARGRTSQAGREESKQARSKAEAEIYFFRLGPRLAALGWEIRFPHLAGDFGPSQTLADDLPHSSVEAVTVSQLVSVSVLAIVEPEHLFVYVSLQVR